MTRALLALALIGCSPKETDEGVGPADGHPVAEPAPAPAPTPAPVAAPVPAGVAGAVNAFGADLHRILVAQDPNDDTFFSPVSVEVALGMTMAGAAGETEAGMRRALHLDGVGHDALGPAASGWNAGPEAPYQLAVANRIWVHHGLVLGPTFTDVTSRHYGAGFAQLDLTTPAAAPVINGWVAERTNDRIQDLVPVDAFQADTRMVLTNAVFFKGTWKNAFDPAETARAPFTRLTADTVEVDLMHRRGVTTWAGLDGFQLVALPYAGDRLEMVVLVPDAVDGIVALEGRLTAENLTTWRAAAGPREIELFLPKFELSTSYELSQPLTSLGMGQAFTDFADFSVMSPDEPLKISLVLHKAFVAVDEAGTEAAAATAVVMVRATSVMEPEPTPVVRADHPFVFAIRDVESGALLFLGRMADPS